MSFEFQQEPRIPDKGREGGQASDITRRGGQGLLILRVRGELKQPPAPLVPGSHARPHPYEMGWAEVWETEVVPGGFSDTKCLRKGRSLCRFSDPHRSLLKTSRPWGGIFRDELWIPFRRLQKLVAWWLCFKLASSREERGMAAFPNRLQVSTILKWLLSGRHNFSLIQCFPTKDILWGKCSDQKTVR